MCIDTFVSVLVMGIGIARGEYDWVLQGLLDIILTLIINIVNYRTSTVQ